MDRRWIELDSIHVAEDRHRGVDMDKVREIALSISRVGLMNRPAVRIVPSMTIDGEELTAVPILIAGHHRIRALKMLGKDDVECDVYDVGEKRAELMEIEENLERAELGPALERWSLLRRCILVQEIEEEERDAGAVGGKSFSTNELRSDGRRKGPQHEKQFAAELADLTGESKQGINKKLAEARKLGDTLKRLAGTILDKGVEIAALAKIKDDSARDQAIEDALAKKPAREAKATRPSNVVSNDAALDNAIAVIDRYGADDMSFLLPLLKPGIAAAVRSLLSA